MYASHSVFRQHKVQKDEREKAGENFRESAHSFTGHAQSSQKIRVRGQTRYR